LASSFYVDADTFYHRLDPRVKIIFTVAQWTAVMFWMSQLYLQMGLFVFNLIHAYFTKSLGALKKLYYIMVAVLFTGVIGWSIMATGPTPLFGPFTLEPVLQGVATALRTSVGIASSIVLLCTTRNEEFSEALTRFKLPYRLGFAFSSALRMAPTLIGVTTTVRDAQRSRGLDLDSGSFFDRFKKFVPLFAPAFLLTMRGTDQLAMAIDAKGFGYQKDRGNYLKLEMKVWDYIVIVVSIIFMAAVIYISVNNLFVVYVLD